MKTAMLILFVGFAMPAMAQQTRGICKGDPVPPSRVVIGEYFTPQCPTETIGDNADTNTPNALILGEPHDGLNVCNPPPTMGYFICEKKEKTNSCGDHDTYLLSTPSSCAISPSRLAGLDLAIYCPDRPMPNGWVMVGRTHSQFCNLPGTDNAWIIRRVSSSTLVLPGPRSTGGSRVAQSPPWEAIDFQTNPAWKCKISDALPPTAVIVGRFATASCPKVPSSSLNGDAMVLLPPKPSGAKYDVCIDSPIPAGYTKVSDPPVIITGYRIRNSGKRSAVFGPGPVRNFHKPDCGGSGLNAISLQ